MNLRFHYCLLIAALGCLVGTGSAEQSSSSSFWAPRARGGAVTTGRAAWGIKQPKQKITLKTTTTTSTNTVPLKQQQNQLTKEEIDSFLTRDSRNTFIARVYAILAGQMTITAAVITLFSRNPQWSRWMRTSGAVGAAVPSLSLLLSTIAWYTMSKWDDARRKAPMNWNLLFLFTLGEAVSVGFITSFFKFHSVVKHLGITAAATAAVAAYTIMNKNPRYDLSQWGKSLSSMGMIIVGYGMIHLLELLGILPHGFMPYSDFWYSAISACLFSFYLAHHTRLIVAGKYSKYQMSEKDYIFGAMTLYNDVINLFIYLLKAFGEEDH